MSKLDRAFIRAFNRDRTSPAPDAESPVAVDIMANEPVDLNAAEAYPPSPSEYPAQVLGIDPELPTTEELYGFAQPPAANTRILRADGPVKREHTIPAPHISFDDLAASSAADEPLFANRHDCFDASSSLSETMAAAINDAELTEDALATEPASSMRLYFGEDAQPPRAAEITPVSEDDGPPARPRPTLSLYRESSWDDNWDSEPLDRGGLFGEAADEPPAAAFEVQRFAWPSMCDTLIQSAGQLFESLATALVTAGHEGHNRILFTGGRSGAGCTTIALAAARRLAADGHSVVLVDANWRHPQLAARLGLRPQSGWREIVYDQLPVDEALVESRDDHLCLLPLVERADAPTPGVDSAALAGHVARLGRHYDLVLIDAGALDSTPAAGFELTAHLVNLADVVILVQDMRSTQQQDAARLQETLDRAGLAWWGTVENFVPAA